MGEKWQNQVLIGVIQKPGVEDLADFGLVEERGKRESEAQLRHQTNPSWLPAAHGLSISHHIFTSIYSNSSGPLVREFSLRKASPNPGGNALNLVPTGRLASIEVWPCLTCPDPHPVFWKATCYGIMADVSSTRLYLGNLPRNSMHTSIHCSPLVLPGQNVVPGKE